MSSVTTIEAFESSSPVKPESFLLGYVDGYAKIDPVEVGIEADLTPQAVWRVAIDDPYVSTRTANERMEVRTAEMEADSFARERRINGSWARKPGTAYVTENGTEERKERWGDPASRDKFFDSLGSNAIALWQKDLIPSAKALAYLSDPTSLAIVESRDGLQKEPVDEIARQWFSLCTDAIGIRSRATVLSESIKDYVLMTEKDEKSADELRWMSVACGTALPTIKAAVTAKVAPKMHLLDLDENAMEATSSLADELNFEGQIEKHSVNIFRPSEMNRLRQELASLDELPDIIDMMGIFEYTGENIKIDPAAFLRSCYDFLKPGGRLIFGQMRADRPVSDFTMGVVSWPYIHMRSPSEVMGIIRAAGILPEQTRLFLPNDGVYMVGVIDKPTLD